MRAARCRPPGCCVAGPSAPRSFGSRPLSHESPTAKPMRVRDTGRVRGQGVQCAQPTLSPLKLRVVRRAESGKTAGWHGPGIVREPRLRRPASRRGDAKANCRGAAAGCRAGVAVAVADEPPRPSRGPDRARAASSIARLPPTVRVPEHEPRRVDAIEVAGPELPKQVARQRVPFGRSTTRRPSINVAHGRPCVHPRRNRGASASRRCAGDWPRRGPGARSWGSATQQRTGNGAWDVVTASSSKSADSGHAQARFG